MSTGAAADLAYVFSSQGGEWPGMAEELRTHAAFSAAVAECDAVCRDRFDWSILDELSLGSDADPHRVQPVLTAVQIGLAAVLAEAGLTPNAVVGLSMGELAAAWTIGALSTEDAIVVAGTEAEVIRLPLRPGQMALVFAPSREVLEAIGRMEDVWIAVELSPASTVITGEEGAVDGALDALAARGHGTRRRTLRYAFHCAEMAPLRRTFLAATASIRPRSARVPFYSSLTGAAVDTSQLTSDYWWRVMSRPAPFTSAVRSMADAGIRAFAEVGPHPILSAAVVGTAPGATVMPTMSADLGPLAALEAIGNIAHSR